MQGREVEMNPLEKIACGRIKNFRDGDDGNEIEDEKESNDFATIVFNRRARLSGM